MSVSFNYVSIRYEINVIAKTSDLKIKKSASLNVFSTSDTQITQNDVGPEYEMSSLLALRHKIIFCSLSPNIGIGI